MDHRIVLSDVLSETFQPHSLGFFNTLGHQTASLHRINAKSVAFTLQSNSGARAEAEWPSQAFLWTQATF